MLILKNEALSFKQLIHKNKSVIFMAKKDADVKLYNGSHKKHWVRLKQLNESGYEVFMTINSMSGADRNANSCTKINALFVDHDNGDWSSDNIDEFLKKFPVKPHLVVETSPGNYHVYWLGVNVPVEAFKEVQQKLAAKFDSDPVVCDLPRLMRMPGTYNNKLKHQDKDGKPFLANIVHFDKNIVPMILKQFMSEMFGAEIEGNVTAAMTAPTLSVVAAKPVDKGDVRNRIDAALKQICADDRRIWIMVGMALMAEFGADGLSIFIEWSKTSTKYDEAVTLQQWASFKAKGGVTIATLFYLAKIAPKPINTDDASFSAISTRLELAEYFAKELNGRLKFCEESNSWYVFSYGKWFKSDGQAHRVAIAFMKAMKAAVTKSSDLKLRDFIDSNQAVAGVRELLNSAQSDLAMTVNQTEFDARPHVIGVKLPVVDGGTAYHGVVNLKLNKFKLAKPEDMVLKTTGAVYDPGATCDLWRSFIEQVTMGDAELAEFLQLAVGYTLYGHTAEQVMFILIGSGGNGKGVFSRIIYSLLGDYSALMQSNLLKPGAINANNPSPALMKLESKRIWVCSEVPKGMVLDEAITKQITGGDLIGSRKLYGNQVEFLPIGKLWLLVNDMPRIRHDDNGMWRRILPIPFNAVFKGSSRDNDLESKLKAELSGILNWALEGAKKYAKRGKLVRPSASQKLFDTLRHNVDTVGSWLKFRCVRISEARLPSQQAYDDYLEAMKREKASPLPQKEFKAELIKLGYKHKQSRNFNYYEGLSLKGG